MDRWTKNIKTLRVDHNDEVVLRITSDREATFHLHGYDLEASLTPGETAALAFTANATGKFDFEMHTAYAGHDGSVHTHDSIHRKLHRRAAPRCTAEPGYQFDRYARAGSGYASADGGPGELCAGH